MAGRSWGETSVCSLMPHALARLADEDPARDFVQAELGCDVLWTEDSDDGQVLRRVRRGDPVAGQP